MTIAADSLYRASPGLTADQWHACRSSRKTRWDHSLISADRDYLRYAEANESHFRLADVDARQLSNRHEYTLKKRPGVWLHKPEPNAISYYGDLHGGALLMAHAAGLQADKKKKTLELGAAVFLELSALHYLQDSVAAGHILRHPLPGKEERRRYHNGGNDGGVAIVIPASAQSILKAAPHPKLFGDGSIWCSQAAWNDGGLTAAYGALVTSVSVDEVDRAYRDQSISTGWDPAQGSTAGKLCDNEFVPAELLPLQNELCKWWEAGPEVSADQRKAEISELRSKGYYRAVSLLPTLPADGQP